MATHWQEMHSHSSQDGDGTQPLFDPYFNWAELTQYAFLGGKPKAIPVLLELNTSLREFAALSWDTDHESTHYLFLPRMFSDPLPPLESSTFCIAIVTAQFFTALRDSSKSLAKVVKRFELGAPIRSIQSLPFGKGGPAPTNPSTDGHTTRQRTPGQLQSAQAGPSAQAPASSGLNIAASSAPVIMGVIDDGIAFAHERFRDTTSGTPMSRIESYWDQDLPPQGIGVPEPLTGWGWTFAKAHLDQMFQQAAKWGGVDEDAMYRMAGLRFDRPGHKSIAHRAAHGTHVMDLACGHDPATVNAQSPRIVAVKLPDAVTEQTSGTSLTLYAMAAIMYILRHAWNAGRVPVVINLSYGMTSGSHDGTTGLEVWMDQVIRLCWIAAQWRVSIVLPSGNSHQTRGHARIAVPPAAAVASTAATTLRWQVLPDDRTPSFLEVWMPCDAKKGEIELRVTTPTGDRSGWIQEGMFVVWVPAGLPVASVDYMGFGSLGSRRMALISLFPTASIVAGQQTVPSGSWTVEVRNVGSALRWVEGRIRRDDNAFGYPIVGRQSRFEDRRYVRFGRFGLPLRYDTGSSYIVRAGSINGIATGSRPVVVAGCRLTDLATAPYSGAGPVTRPRGCGPLSRFGPDAMAPVDRSIACHGILAAGTRSGSTVALNGTSVAAPQVARYLAKIMQSGAAGDRADASAEAVVQEINRAGWIPPLRYIPTIQDGGSGRIELPAGDLPSANGKGPPQFR